jgi:hypothetical protein
MLQDHTLNSSEGNTEKTPFNFSDKLVSSPGFRLGTSRIQVRGNIDYMNIEIKTGLVYVIHINFKTWVIKKIYLVIVRTTLRSD